MAKAMFNFKVEDDPMLRYTVNLPNEEREKMRAFAKETGIPMAELFRNFKDKILEGNCIDDIMEFVELNNTRGRKWDLCHFSVRESDIKKLREISTELDVGVPKLFRAYLKMMGVI